MYAMRLRRTRFVDLPLFSGRYFTLFVLFFTLVMEALIAELHFPGSIRYLNDLLIFSLFLTMAVRPYRTARVVGIPILIATLVVFFVFSASSIVNGVRIELYLWASRNTFRGLVFFFACVTYLRKDDLPFIFDKLYVLQIISLVLALYQRFVLGLTMDYVGGIFGHGNGAGVNPFNALLFAYFLNQYLAGRTSVRKLVVVTLSSFIIAAVAEEKFTFVAFAVITLVSLLLTKVNTKVALAIVVVAVAGYVGMRILRTMYPAMFDILSSFDAIEGYLTSTSEGGYELPRVGSFSVIENLIFNNDPTKRLLGVGFGNGETSNFSFLVGPYYTLYGYLHYRWFTHQWTFFECGYLGFFAYLAFFIVVAVSLFATRWKAGEEELSSLTCCFALSLCVIISIWYNATLKTDMCYISYFSLAIGFIAMKRKSEGAVR